jgi:uncharacterized membrane protein
MPRRALITLSGDPMANVLAWLINLQLHPIADHFTIALLFIAVLIDLVASLAPSRAWLRYMAVTLMVLGAVAAAASWATGGMLQPKWVWKAIPPEAKALMHRHAELGEILMYVFGVLAVWRILIESLSFMAKSRAIYLIVAIVAIGVIGYQGHLGGELVYAYGVGTELSRSTPVPTPALPAAAMSPGPIPTVTVPTPNPSASASAAPSVAASPAPVQSPPNPSLATPTSTPGKT